MSAYTDMLKQQTREEFDRLAKHGVVKTMEQYRAECLAIGYRLDTDRRSTCAMGAYTNAHNRVAYLAFGVSYTHIATGAGFANIAATRETLPELQALRRETVILHRGRLVET